jgi:hypothetical protein
LLPLVSRPPRRQRRKLTGDIGGAVVAHAAAIGVTPLPPLLAQRVQPPVTVVPPAKVSAERTSVLAPLWRWPPALPVPTVVGDDV